MPGSDSTICINALLKKTENYDKDERYMALSDLCEVVKRYASASACEGYGKIDSTTERRICTAVLSLLKDKSNDVQAVALKTLGVLLTTVQEEQVLEIADSLTDQILDQSKSELRDVYAIGLRTLCKTVPSPMGDRVSQRLVGRLLGRMSSDDEVILACLDILTDLLSRFGKTAASLTHQHELILQMCLQQLNSASHLIRKRAGNAIGFLSGVLSDRLLVHVMESLLSQIQVATSNKGDTRALIRTMCCVSGVVGHRLGHVQIDRIVPLVLSFLQPEEARTGDDVDEENQMDDDSQETCFKGFQSFVLKTPLEDEPHPESTIQAALAHMRYVPNFSYDDDDEVGDDIEEEDDFDDGDEDNDSWKVRRAAIRALTAAVESTNHDPSLLWSKGFIVRCGKSTTDATALVRRVNGRDENCRVDVIDCFTKLLSVAVLASVNGVVSNAPDADLVDAGVVIGFHSKDASNLVKASETLLSEQGDDNEDALDESWFGGGFAFDDSDAELIESQFDEKYSKLDRAQIMSRIRSTEVDYAERAKLVELQMGSMALCRGDRGEELVHAGAIYALLSTLTELCSKIPAPRKPPCIDLEVASIVQLAISCLGAIRDLACGSAGTREALRKISFDGMGGMQLLSEYLRKYHNVYWNELDSIHLKLLTCVIGALRNVTHSTTENCKLLHHHGVLKMLIWRLKHSSGQDVDTTPSLPATSVPWREASFRSASTLINMAEKCMECAEICARDPDVIRLLVESWGGCQRMCPLLHLGLAAVLRCAKHLLPTHLFDQSWDIILANEQHRKAAAQKREEQRKGVASSTEAPL
jgi:hypothetical protein